MFTTVYFTREMQLVEEQKSSRHEARRVAIDACASGALLAQVLRSDGWVLETHSQGGGFHCQDTAQAVAA